MPHTLLLSMKPEQQKHLKTLNRDTPKTKENLLGRF